MRKFLMTALLAGGVIACSAGNESANAETADAAAAEMGGSTIDTVLASADRAEDAARDQYRHPKETLAFFKVEPNMTVVEFGPGGGWYTRVLAPLVGTEGRYIALNGSPKTLPEAGEARAKLDAWPTKFKADMDGWLKTEPDRYGIYNSYNAEAAASGTADRALVFRAMHNLMRGGTAAQELKVMHGLLKPDGLLGIVQHRAKADAPADYVDGSKGYLKQADVITFVEAQGFELVDTSEINANPKDMANYPGGVWTLPPVLGQKDKDQEKYESIGESDRMTLLFKKK